MTETMLDAIINALEHERGIIDGYGCIKDDNVDDDQYTLSAALDNINTNVYILFGELDSEAKSSKGGYVI